MKKVYLISLGLAVILAGATIIIRSISRTTKDVSATTAQAQSSAVENRPACRKDDTPDLHLSSRDTKDIPMAGVTYITDVPAGTNADVRIASYDGTTMTGATIYPSKYGSYNFQAKKIKTASENQISWQVTGFTACHEN